MNCSVLWVFHKSIFTVLLFSGQFSATGWPIYVATRYSRLADKHQVVESSRYTGIKGECALAAWDSVPGESAIGFDGISLAIRIV